MFKQIYRAVVIILFLCSIVFAALEADAPLSIQQALDQDEMQTFKCIALGNNRVDFKGQNGETVSVNNVKVKFEYGALPSGTEGLMSPRNGSIKITVNKNMEQIFAKTTGDKELRHGREHELKAILSHELAHARGAGEREARKIESEFILKNYWDNEFWDSLTPTLQHLTEISILETTHFKDEAGDWKPLPDPEIDKQLGALGYSNSQMNSKPYYADNPVRL